MNLRLRALYKGRNKIKTWAYLLDHLAWEWGKSLIYIGLSLMPASSQAKVPSVCQTKYHTVELKQARPLACSHHRPFNLNNVRLSSPLHVFV